MYVKALGLVSYCLVVSYIQIYFGFSLPSISLVFSFCEAQAKAKAKDRPGMVTKRSLKALRLKPLPRAYIKVGCHHHIAASSTKSLKIRLLNS